MDQRKAPLYEGLINHLRKNPISFHVPGHKYGTVFPEIAQSQYNDILKLDVTELNGLDDLHSPHSIIMDAQNLTADLYKVMKSYFLVGGSTAGNLAMILSVCQTGDTVLVQRNCHKSIIHGLQLAGATPVFLAPVLEKTGFLPIGPSLDNIRNEIGKHQKVTAIILTYPNYYGMASRELGEIIDFCHEKKIPVLIDEAHGAHFCKYGSESLPQSSLRYGADVVVHSAHKTLPAMTMGSYLHFNSQLVDRSKVEFYLQALQTSSPSYPILASLDLARYYLASIADIDVKEIIAASTRFRDQLHSIPQIQVVPQVSTHYLSDPLKVTVQTRCSLSGYELQLIFDECGVFTELADPFHVLFVLPFGAFNEAEETLSRIKAKLKDFKIVSNGAVNTLSFDDSNNSTLALAYKDVTTYKTEEIDINASVGRISAMNVVAYPPGIPIILTGERITAERMRTVVNLKRKGARFQGEETIWDKGIEVFIETAKNM
jgi:arginine/lysine/ornithine decarboxylase